MRKNLSRALSVTLAGAMVLGTMAGTGFTAKAADDTTSGDKTTITVNVQAGPGAETAWKAVADAYMEKNPDVNVVVDLKPTEGYGDWLQNVFTSGGDTTTDIVNINLAGATKTGKSINFLEYADMDSPYSDGIWTDQFEFQQQVVDQANGTWDALSLDSVQVVWLYNKDIFEEVGVQPPKTWDEFVDVCQKLMDAGYQPLSVAGDFDSFWSTYMGWLAQIYADQTTRSMINVYRAQKGDYCYDPDVDADWEYDPTDPFNDDTWKVNTNTVRAYKAFADGEYDPASAGMKTVWTNLAKIFPKYAGGDAFFGTKDGIPLFYQGKAAITLDGAWRLVNYKNDMEKIASGEEITNKDEKIEGVQKFNIGTFNMPSMEGEGIEAPARTIEVANGFLGAVKKDKEHDAKVVDFLMFYSSSEGMGTYINAGIEDGLVINGPSLVHDVVLPEEVGVLFEGLEFIGNCQKGSGTMLARGMASTNGDIQESYRQFYDYSYEYLSGKTTIDDWLAAHKANLEQYFPESMEKSGISESDLENPQNAPTGQ